MTRRLVHASYRLPEWQAVKNDFLCTLHIFRAQGSQHSHVMVYPASRVFSLTWFLRLRSHVCRIVGMLTPCETTQQRSHANNSINTKSHSREKPLLAGHVMVELEMIIQMRYIYLH